jgi:hypothetical protein
MAFSGRSDLPAYGLFDVVLTDKPAHHMHITQISLSFPKNDLQQKEVQSIQKR